MDTSFPATIVAYLVVAFILPPSYTRVDPHARLVVPISRMSPCMSPYVTSLVNSP